LRGFGAQRRQIEPIALGSKQIDGTAKPPPGTMRSGATPRAAARCATGSTAMTASAERRTWS
jgi:hypothetical protein